MSAQTIETSETATTTARDRITHLSADDGRTSLCGAPITGGVSSGGKCVVCLELAHQDRWWQR
jgi:hypothetical protein